MSDREPQTTVHCFIRKGVAYRADVWHDGLGPVLWWRFPIEEPPYVGTPLDTGWPGYHTHWTPLRIPERAEEDQND